MNNEAFEKWLWDYVNSEGKKTGMLPVNEYDKSQYRQTAHYRNQLAAWDAAMSEAQAELATKVEEVNDE